MQWPWFKAIPLAHREQLQYRFQVSAPLAMSGFCRQYESTLSGVVLRDCLCNTSQYVQGGLLLRESWTLMEELVVIDTAVAVLSLSVEERADLVLEVPQRTL